ncbi:MAG: AlkA N-terminal domain-containing protein [Blastopirellula sp. JB062]
MDLNPQACYRALLARDERHDGRFFTCVKTTRIYCRPICPAQPPKFNNCHFVLTAAAAQEAGYRPCLRCRPETAPGLGGGIGAAASVSRALRLIDEGALDDEKVETLAQRLGIGERQLRRLFQRYVGASPNSVAQTRRILLALQLLHQTNLSMTQVALGSGFQSLRRFNETFQHLYDRPPSQIRRHRSLVDEPTSCLSLLLPYRQPYDWSSLLQFFALRAIPGLEVVADNVYSRVIQLDGDVGTLQVNDAPAESALRISLRFPRLDKLPQIIARIRRMFDLNADINAIATALAQDPAIGPLVKSRPGLRIPGAWDPFEIAVRAILGQQISVSAARKLAGKLVATYGEPIGEALATPGLTHRFPQPDRFQLDAIKRLGMPQPRAFALVRLAETIDTDPHFFDSLGNLENAIQSLCKLPGIGKWTAQYIAMRVLRESDAFLADDVGLQRVLAVDGVRPNAAQLLARSERWKPWRAYAVMHFWTSESANSHFTPSQETANAVST